jgi:hypothetical protein
MNYKIIQDEKEFRKFIDWLPDLEDNEKYYLSLFARKKYCEELIKSNDKTQIKRFTSYKDDIYRKVKQLECEVGSYYLKDREVPQESLVLYINPNPRNMRRATFQLIKKCTDILETNGMNYNIHAEALSCIQRSKSKTHFCDFDIDSKDVSICRVKEILPDNTYDIIETRGGYHVLVKTRLAPKTKWHKELRDAFVIDQIGDQMIPVVGCTQGGFVPKFIKI